MRMFSLGRRPYSPFVLRYSPDSGTLAATTPTSKFGTRDVWQWELAEAVERRSEQRLRSHQYHGILTYDELVFGTKTTLPPFRFAARPGSPAAGFRLHGKALTASIYASMIRYNRMPLASGRMGFGFVTLIRDATDPQDRRRVEWVAESWQVGMLELSAAGEWVTAQVGHAIRVWDTKTGDQLAEVRLPRQQPRALAFSADGQYLAIAFKDVVKFFETRSWTEAKAYGWSIGKLECLAFSPDGATAAVGSDKGKVVVFDLD